MSDAFVHAPASPEAAPTSDAASWQARNAEYLSAALAALRQRLQAAARISRAVAPQQRTAPESPPEEQARPAPASDRGPMGFFWRRASTSSEPAAAAPVPLLASASAPAIEVPADDPVRRMAAASEGEPPPALLMLARRLGLSAFDRDILLLCVAIELDPAVAPLLALVHGHPDRDYPSFATAMNLFDRPEWEAVSPERPLRYWRLIDINQPGSRALTASALRADERIVNYVKGLNYLDDRLAPLVLRMHPPQVRTLPPSQEAAVRAMAQALGTATGTSTCTLMALRGSDRPSKQEVAAALSARLGLSLHRLPADALPSQAGELETLARLWTRESLLLPLALYIDAHELDSHAGPDSPAQRLARFVARLGGLVFVDSREGIGLGVEALATLDVARPTPAEQQQAWANAIGDLAAELARRLAGQFDLSRPDIEAILKSVPAAQPGSQGTSDAAALEPALWDACRARTRPALSRLAEKIDARATWKQLVLPPTETALLRQIAGQVRTRTRVYDDWGFRMRMTRGLGVSALFAGDSGTGKTMAAEVLANDLRLDLYRIDLSAVVSKYIGETEKNLREVFDAAERGGAILLFDEADALFGKRSEVKDSHDRYANIEVDYLLQRMESFAGLAILATNMKSALDPAFVRRLRFIVTFPYPGPAERRRMWEGVFPKDTPVGNIDHERLARLHLTGGNIQSMALTAAFMAAQLDVKDEERRVTMPLLLDAGRMEFRKLDRPVNEADFRWAETREGAA